MRNLFHFSNWSLRLKIALLLVGASTIPVMISAYVDIRDARERQTQNMIDILSARADQLVGRLDNFNQRYSKSVFKFTKLSAIVEYCSNGFQGNGHIKRLATEAIGVQPTVDEQVRGFAILDTTGKVKLSTELPLMGKNLGYYGFIRESLKREEFISDIFVATSEVDYQPTIAYVRAIRSDEGRLVGLGVLWVKATALWAVMKESNELAGPQSFSVILNTDGIRLAHTRNEDFIFHPAAPLDPALVARLSDEEYYGPRTREILEDVRSFPEQAKRAQARVLDTSLILDVAPSNNVKNYGIARRLASVPWTLFFMIPEHSFAAVIAEVSQEKLVLVAIVILGVLIVGSIFARTLILPIKKMSAANERFANGDLTTRVEVNSTDELGHLGQAFNTMAEKIEAQSNSLQKARDELTLSNKELDAFSYSVSHDLRAPLRAIDGFSRILLEDFSAALPPEGRQYLERVRRNAQKMGKLVEDLLSFSRLGRHPIEKRVVDVDLLVAQILEEMQAEIASHPVELRIQKMSPCFGDPALLKQVWVNLIGNALKYSRRQELAVVEIGMAPNDKVNDNVNDKTPAVYFVKDNGVGFDMAYKDKLFGVFQRLHREEDFEGTGVGLAISQRIVLRHGGRIWADAHVGQGATFYFSI